MKNKKIFSPKLYKEGLKQLKVFGIIFLILYMLEASLIFINYISVKRAMLDIFSIHPTVLCTYTVVAPLLTLYLFRFLTSRSSSDFYHSIPNTRTCVFVSYISAIITWIAIIHLITSGIVIAAYSCFPQKFSMNLGVLFAPVVGTFIAAIAVTCGIALAQCITGTILTNIIVTAIILFMPRLLTTVFMANFQTLTHGIIPFNSYSPMLNGSYNMITTSVFSILGNYNPYMFTSAFEWIYTFALAAIYFIIGIILYNKRNSETAGNASPNRLLQAIYRICVTTVVCLIPISILCDYNDSLNYTELITSYAVAIVVYFIFELVTTRTTKNLVRIIPGLLIIAVINIVMIVGIRNLSKSELNTIPTSSDIDYVQISPTSNEWYGDNNMYNYNDLLKENIKINDSDVINNLISSLSIEIEGYNNNPSYYPSSKSSYTFKLHYKNGKTIYRSIFITNKIASDINAFCLADSDYSKNINTMPDYTDVNIEFSMTNLSAENSKELYDTFKEEYDSLDANTKLNIINSSDDNYYSNDTENILPYMDSMIITINYHGKHGRLSVNINSSLPKTSAKFIECSYASPITIKRVKSMLNDIEEYVSVQNDDISLSIDYDNKAYYSNYWYDGEQVITGHNTSSDTEEQSIRKTENAAFKVFSSAIPDTYEDYLSKYGTEKMPIILCVYGNSGYNQFILPPTTEVLDALNSLPLDE